ncbi:polyketide synthase [Tautonia plasticadhaerens]|uniref:Phthiocerol/phenolphthiocerol synthesis polyketide synthase type I PpsE n=1 Tax=Tautonia plasticadhaerens TaxID=2527974 RepID=A0A518H0L6_9BACT|nr:polyketide synthase [Tautonia plasticadhaerens]QDV34368.1 Phthiocerol/phenolphthiocerol synthesis polyketide synthase type I PpsE [Tautonia plasticadhaerens]
MSRTPRPLDAAIVGMACRFAGAGDLFAFWDDVLAGRALVPGEEGAIPDPGSIGADRSPGGALAGPIASGPDAVGGLWGASDASGPGLVLALDAARAALADAGLGEGIPEGRRVEVVIGRRAELDGRAPARRRRRGRVPGRKPAISGALHPGWSAEDEEAVRAGLVGGPPPLAAAGGADAVSGPSIGLPGRLGPVRMIDAGGASALEALARAARAVSSGRADLAIAGAVHLDPDGEGPIGANGRGPRPRTDRARPMPGEGVGVVVLRPLRDAERDGDRIYAVVKGAGLDRGVEGDRDPAPAGARGLLRAIRRAYRRSGIDPGTVGLLEGGGPGMPACGRAELRALRAAFPPPGSGMDRVLGAASAVVGPAGEASGMAGLIKASLALHHRILPASPAAGDPRPRPGRDVARSATNPSSRPWISGLPTPRRAGISASGHSGINAHVILEEHGGSDREVPGALPRWPDEAVLLAGEDRAGLADRARRLADRLRARPDLDLKDVAARLNGEAVRAGAPARLGLVARSVGDLVERLESAAGRLDDPGRGSIRDARGAYYWDRPAGASGGLAFLFPGEGSQYPGMLADLCMHFPEVRGCLDRIDRMALASGAIDPPGARLYGAGAGVDPSLWEAGTAVHVVLGSQWALYTLLTRLGLEPDAVCGHSSGEFPALVASGAIPDDDGLEARLIGLAAVFSGLERSGAIPEARLLGVGADRSRVEALLGSPAGTAVAVAADNCPHQVVIVGGPAAIREAAGRLKSAGISVEELPFSRAYHCPEFGPAMGPIRAFFESIPIGDPSIPLYSCCLAGRVSGGPDELRRLAVAQWTRPVEFRRAVEAMHVDGIRLFVDVGARGNLAGFVEDTLRGRDAFAVAANLPRRSGLSQLNHLVASLFAQGATIDPAVLYSRRRPMSVDLEGGPPTGARGVTMRPESPGPRAGLRPEDPGGSRPSRPPGRRDEWGEVGPDARLAVDADWDAPAAPAREVSVPGGREAGAGTSTRGEGVAVGLGPAPGRGVTGGAREGAAIEATAGRCVVRRILDAEGDPVAEAHTFGGRRISAIDSDMKGLPVLPFTVMAEMLAEASARLVPGGVLVGLRDVRARRWVRYEDAPTLLEIVAEADPDRPGEVRAGLFHRGRADRPGPRGDRPEMEAVVVLSGDRPGAPGASPFDLGEAEASRFTAESLYGEQWLFHGPALRGVVGVGEVSDRGIEGTLRVLPRGALRREAGAPMPLTDPIVLDAFTHLLGCWGLDRLADGDVIFPLRMGRLEFFGEDPPEGADVPCRIEVTAVDRHRVRADAEILRPDGRVWMRLRDWEDWRFDWPARYRDLFRQPDRILLGEPIGLAGLPAGTSAVWLRPPEDMGRPVWRDVLERVQLSPRERAGCLRPEGSDRRRTLRLWGRIAAKEAARRLWLAEGRGHLYPADLTIEPDESGRPVLLPGVGPGGRDMPILSISHTEGVAVALASRDPGARVGIDVERITPRSGSFEDLAFGPGERALLDRFDAERRPEWVARLWCAREAVAKATGLGMIDGPRGVEVTAIDPASGMMAARLGTGLASACPGLAGGGLDVGTTTREGYALAWFVRGGAER